MVSIAILILGVGLFQKVCSDVIIEFVGNEEASDGVTYWATEIPNVEVSVTSNCTTNETNWFSITNTSETFYYATLTIDENCASCVCTTINSTTSVSTECVATTEEYIFRATISGLSSETTNFTVEFTNSTVGLTKTSAFRSCSKSELQQNFAVETNTTQEYFHYLEGVDVTCPSCSSENSTIRVVCDVSGEWNDTEVNCDERCGHSATSTATPVVEYSTANDVIDSSEETESDASSTSEQSNSTGTLFSLVATSSGLESQTTIGIATRNPEPDGEISTLPTRTVEISQDSAKETDSSQHPTATSRGLESTEEGNGGMNETESSSNANTPMDDVTTSQNTSTNNYFTQTVQLIAVCVVTNVIMLSTCCVMMIFCRHKRSDKRRLRQRKI